MGHRPGDHQPQLFLLGVPRAILGQVLGLPMEGDRQPVPVSEGTGAQLSHHVLQRGEDAGDSVASAHPRGQLPWEGPGAPPEQQAGDPELPVHIPHSRTTFLELFGPFCVTTPTSPSAAQPGLSRGCAEGHAQTGGLKAPPSPCDGGWHSHTGTSPLGPLEAAQEQAPGSTSQPLSGVPGWQWSF